MGNFNFATLSVALDQPPRQFHIVKPSQSSRVRVESEGEGGPAAGRPLPGKEDPGRHAKAEEAAGQVVEGQGGVHQETADTHRVTGPGRQKVQY